MRILAAADVHLGMKFSTFEEVSVQLSEARFAALDRCVQTANERMCELFVVAGDLFDRVTVSGSDITKAASILSGFEGAALLILPGNHDFYTGADSKPWSEFKGAMEATSVPLVLLSANRPYDLAHFDLPVTVLPAPCTAKHAKMDNIWWTRSEVEQPVAGEDRLVLGIAHGSVEGQSFDKEGRYYPMTVSQLQQGSVDLWIIGHTHRPFPEQGVENPPFFIPGTPEPDGFDCNHTGGAWIIDCSERRVESFSRVETGTYSFIEEEVTIDEVSVIESAVSVPEPDRLLVSFTLKGALTHTEYEKLPAVLGTLRERFFYLRASLSNLERVVSSETVDAEFTPGSFAHNLLSSLIDRDDVEAAQLAYRLLRETGS